jgi:ElaA protein
VRRMLSWQFKHFSELTLHEFHDLVALRIAVFVVEQNCPYQELDGKDKKCYHLICRNGAGEIIGTLRILPPGIGYEEVGIGRVVIAEHARGNKTAHEMMRKSLEFIQEEFGIVSIKLSAQKHLEMFYAAHNFVSTGKEYLEDGIPHVEMIKKHYE